MSKNRQSYVTCIVAAGGSGTRMGADINKLFLKICGVPVIAHTLLALEKSAYIDEIVLSAREEDMMELQDIVKSYSITKATAIVRGGAYRSASVKAAMGVISEQTDFVAVHDGARPLVEEEVIGKVVEAAENMGAAATGVRPKCTLKKADVNGIIQETVDRSVVFEIQTPQVFDKALLMRAYDTDETTLKAATDDCSLVERLGADIQVTEGSYRNIKITTSEDILIAESLLEGTK